MSRTTSEVSMDRFEVNHSLCFSTGMNGDGARRTGLPGAHTTAGGKLTAENTTGRRSIR